MDLTTTPANTSMLLGGDTDNLYEVINGHITEQEPMGAFAVALASELAFFLRIFARQHNLGLVVTEMLFTLDAERDLQRRPDAAFVNYNRWPEATVPRASAWNVVPDLAIEVVSPTNTAEQIDEKIVDYFAAGVRLLWVVFPETARIYVYSSANETKVLERTDELTGGDVLPGFRLQIAELYSGLQKPD